VEAARSFELAMQWGVGVGVGVGRGRGSSKTGSSSSSSSSSGSAATATAATRLEFKGLSLSPPSAACDIYYWHAHALAGQESFSTDRALLLQAISSLEGVLSETCSIDKSVTTELRELAEQQVAKLRQILASIEVEVEVGADSLLLYH